jgi:hypothetical protein
VLIVIGTYIYSSFSSICCIHRGETEHVSLKDCGVEIRHVLGQMQGKKVKLNEKRDREREADSSEYVKSNIKVTQAGF